MLPSTLPDWWSDTGSRKMTIDCSRVFLR